jgi:hypothetical protein
VNDPLLQLDQLDMQTRQLTLVVLRLELAVGGFVRVVVPGLLVFLPGTHP